MDLIRWKYIRAMEINQDTIKLHGRQNKNPVRNLREIGTGNHRLAKAKSIVPFRGSYEGRRTRLGGVGQRKFTCIKSMASAHWFESQYICAGEIK